MSKTAQGLAEYCRAQLGRPYWWGTFGQTATAGLLAAKRAQYPDYYRAGDFESQLGRRVHDCVGLIKGYRWSASEDSAPIYEASQDVAVSGLYEQCSRRGHISAMPDIPGVCVFMAGMGHVGVYAGGGQVIEARGHAYGVVQTALKGRGWAYWGMPDWLDYGADTSAAPAEPESGAAAYMYSVRLPLLKRGSSGGHVRTVQRLLLASGISCGPDGADGELGSNTEDAVKRLQRLHGLPEDGEVGGDTWSALLRG